MHTIWQRISNGSAMLSSFIMGLLAVIAVSSLFLTADPKGVIGVKNVHMCVTTSLILGMLI
jgi:signal peptidase complex subunit 3